MSIEILLIPLRAILRLRGIGVADIAKISIPIWVLLHRSRIFLIFSLSLTPNLCSSSTTKSHKSLNTISSDSNLWVPITMSTCPLLSLASVFSMLLAVSNRVSISIVTPKSANRSFAFSKCS